MFSINKLVTNFAHEAEIGRAIDEHIEKASDGKEAPVRDTLKGMGANERAAALFGAQAANGETLYRPMETGDSQLVLGA